MRWTIRMHPEALAALYRIPRGEVAIVTDAIRGLQRTPRPPDSQESPDRAGIYVIRPGGRVVAYELLESERVVHVIFIG